MKYRPVSEPVRCAVISAMVHDALTIREVAERFGHSPGADRELALAEELGRPVFRSLDEIPVLPDAPGPCHLIDMDGSRCLRDSGARCDAHGWMCQEHWDAHECRCNREEVVA